MTPELLPLPLPHLQPLLIILSGISGAGKDAVLKSLRSSGCPLEYIITVTTRPRRPAEKNEVDYRFVAEAEFQAMVTQQKLLEWARVYGHCYGVPRGPVRAALAAGRDTIIKVDVQGATTIKKILPEAVFVFLTPPSVEEHVRRLEQRRTESPAELELRIRSAAEELQQLNLFDYVVINRRGGVDRAAADIRAIITAEKCRTVSRKIAL